MKKIGLYFGSFNPVHTGHLIIAEYFATQTGLDEVWLVVSPQNPLKPSSSLADENHRLEMVKIALKGNDHVLPCDVEFNLTRPSYTSNTLRVLSANFPDYQFVLICGEDTLSSFHLWKDYQFILDNFPLWVFPRHQERKNDSPIDWSQQVVKMMDAPRIEISSTMVRDLINRQKSTRYLLPPLVQAYITANSLYKGLGTE